MPDGNSISELLEFIEDNFNKSFNPEKDSGPIKQKIAN